MVPFKVKCVDVGGNSHLANGEVYTVIKEYSLPSGIGPVKYYFLEGKGKQSFLADRFTSI